MIQRSLHTSFSLLNVDHVALNSSWNYTNIVSPYYRIYYIDAGQGEISDAGATHTLEPGYLYIIPCFTLCSMRCPEQLSQYFVQFFEVSTNGISYFTHHRKIIKRKAAALDIELFIRLLEINPGRGINRSDNPRIYEKDIYYKEYQAQNNHQSPAVFIQTQSILLFLVAGFVELIDRSYIETPPVPVKVMDTISYILLHLQEALSVAQLARLVNQHVDHFSRQFKLHTGRSPICFIREKRIERAQYLMATTQMTYSEISRQTGFDTLSYFSKTFKKITGSAPGAYRKRLYRDEVHII